MVMWDLSFLDMGNIIKIINHNSLMIEISTYTYFFLISQFKINRRFQNTLRTNDCIVLGNRGLLLCVSSNCTRYDMAFNLGRGLKLLGLIMHVLI